MIDPGIFKTVFGYKRGDDYRFARPNQTIRGFCKENRFFGLFRITIIVGRPPLRRGNPVPMLVGFIVLSAAAILLSALVVRTLLIARNFVPTG